MKINHPGASYKQVHGVFLSTEHAQDGRLLVMMKPGSLKENGGVVTFTAVTFDSSIESLYVPPSERLADR